MWPEFDERSQGKQLCVLDAGVQVISGWYLGGLRAEFHAEKQAFA